MSDVIEKNEAPTNDPVDRWELPPLEEWKCTTDLDDPPSKYEVTNPETGRTYSIDPKRDGYWNIGLTENNNTLLQELLEPGFVSPEDAHEHFSFLKMNHKNWDAWEEWERQKLIDGLLIDMGTSYFDTNSTYYWMCELAKLISTPEVVEEINGFWKIWEDSLSEEDRNALEDCRETGTPFIAAFYRNK